ncbi:trypsin-like peptidase domain-containing protein [Thalassospira sp. HJ]|uniref:trypsin-like peptidase domain-containing protein n=1 Tax=Thalassospira sp. HJ TaxID=1616823 RepID=UPI000697FBA4|nr:trypsin-like peptidase domain-containing protein [Thalassospira sp. HJ]
MFFENVRLATGTAFVVSSNIGPLLITNRHNVTGRNNLTGELLDEKHAAIPDRIVVRHNKQGSLGDGVERLELLYNADGEPRWFEHPTLGAKVDVVALPLTSLDGVSLLPYDLNNPNSEFRVGPADPLSVIGFPFGRTGGGSLAIWATGFVASEIDIGYENLPQFLIDCRTRKGQSGSPVVAYRPKGRVFMKDGDLCTSNGENFRIFGVYSGRINEESDIGIVWKISVVQDLVRSLT